MRKFIFILIMAMSASSVMSTPRDSCGDVTFQRTIQYIDSLADLRQRVTRNSLNHDRDTLTVEERAANEYLDEKIIGCVYFMMKKYPSTSETLYLYLHLQHVDIRAASMVDSFASCGKLAKQMKGEVRMETVLDTATMTKHYRLRTRKNTIQYSAAQWWWILTEYLGNYDFGSGSLGKPAGDATFIRISPASTKIIRSKFDCWIFDELIREDEFVNDFLSK